MVELLVKFLYLFMVATTTVQATGKCSLEDTSVVYEDLFDTYADAKPALNKLRVLPDWLQEQTAIKTM